MVEIDNLSKTYRHRSWRQMLRGRPARRTEALTDISLRVSAGEILGLLGPNGAGKTTLLNVIASLVTPDRGQVRLGGHDVVGDAAWVKRRVGLVGTNDRSFYWRLTGRQNLDFFARLHGLAGLELERRLDELLQLVGLEEKADLPFSGWSTGQRQRLAIARGLLGDPQVLLLDEPTAGLDPLASQQLLELTREHLMGPGRVILWCSHDLVEVEKVCDRVAVLKQGRLVHYGPATELGQEAGLACRVEVASCPDALLEKLPWPSHCLQQVDGRQELEFNLPEKQIPELLQALHGAGVKVYACRPQQPRLEDLYTRLTASEISS